MRQVKRALQNAGISMPDEAREIIFPDGVPVRQVSTEERDAEVKPQPSGPASGDGAVATTGEGDLLSERKELERQADAADLTDAGENLLPAEKRDSTRS
jgi:hypothetical protein